MMFSKETGLCFGLVLEVPNAANANELCPRVFGTDAKLATKGEELWFIHN